MYYFSPEQDRQLCTLLRSLGQQAKAMAGADAFQVMQKGPQDFVTSVDRALDRQLTQKFQQWFPQDGLVTEENTDSLADYGGPYPRVWFVDPLDGTDGFIHGDGSYAVMVGLMKEYQPVGGWIYAPDRDVLYYGGPGWGLYQIQGDGPPQKLPEALPPARSASFCPIMIGHRDEHAYGAVIRRAIPGAQFRKLGSFGLKVMEVILGRAGLYLYLNGRVKLWDTTGPLALARAAGLVCCDLQGRPLRFTPDAVDAQTLAHHQPILIGWRSYLEVMLPQLQVALAAQISG